jgi:hypothetical protein
VLEGELNSINIFVNNFPNFIILIIGTLRLYFYRYRHNIIFCHEIKDCEVW